MIKKCMHIVFTAHICTMYAQSMHIVFTANDSRRECDRCMEAGRTITKIRFAECCHNLWGALLDTI